MTHPVQYIKKPADTDSCVTQISDNVQAWKFNGKLHRVDGPAVVHTDGYEEWWLDGKRHRANGPAVTWPNGDQEWFVNGVRMPDQLTGWLVSGQKDRQYEC